MLFFLKKKKKNYSIGGSSRCYLLNKWNKSYWCYELKVVRCSWSPLPPQWDRSMSKWLIQMILEKGSTKEYCQYSIMLNNARSQWYKCMKMHYYESTQQRLSFNIITQVNDSTLSKSKTITIIIFSIPLSNFFFLKSNEFSKKAFKWFLNHLPS